MKLLIAMSLFLAAAAVLSYSGERAVSADLPRLSPGEFVASVLLAASVFHFGEIKIGDLKAYLKGRGVPVRL